MLLLLLLCSCFSCFVLLLDISFLLVALLVVLAVVVVHMVFHDNFFPQIYYLSLLPHLPKSSVRPHDFRISYFLFCFYIFFFLFFCFFPLFFFFFCLRCRQDASEVTEPETAALADLRARFAGIARVNDEICMRFLRSRALNVDKAAAGLHQHLEFLEAHQPHTVGRLVGRSRKQDEEKKGKERRKEGRKKEKKDCFNLTHPFQFFFFLIYVRVRARACFYGGHIRSRKPTSPDRCRPGRCGSSAAAAAGILSCTVRLQSRLPSRAPTICLEEGHF
jgi:hypothetical protein